MSDAGMLIPPASALMPLPAAMSLTLSQDFFRRLLMTTPFSVLFSFSYDISSFVTDDNSIPPNW
jgi:hypothetical protein